MTYKSKQEIFDTVAKHLLDQSEKCHGIVPYDDTPICLYRYGSLSCAVGCLIPDELYTDEIENTGVRNIHPECVGRTRELASILKKSGIDIYDRDIQRFLAELQDIHDNTEVERWAIHLEQLGTSNGLDVSSVQS